MKNQTFGVEIEMVLRREVAAQAVATFLNGRIERTYDSYRTIKVVAADGRVWKIMSDSSITGGEACEVVSPILNWDDIETIQEILRILRRAGAKINESCGLHIHVGAEKHTGKTLQNLINIFYAKDEMLYEAVQVRTNGINRFAKKFKSNLITQINRIKNPSIAQVLDVWYFVNHDMMGTNRHYHSSRYHGLNLHSYNRIGTVEFRLFNATLHAGELKSYIHMALAINHQALTQKSAKPAKTNEIIGHENYKYTFRCWLLRLKLNGPEFKNTRMHLLKHLKGNTVGNYRAV